jgi:hypothetical protein
MGLGLVLLLWAVVGTILACVGAFVMGAAATLLTRKASKDRSLTLLASVAFPFACLAWAALLFAFQAFVNGSMHRDPGLGDTWNCPLPDGYAITMIDTTDHGWVYNPRTQVEGGISEQDDAVAGVIVVQIEGRYILGGADTHAVFDQNQIDSYFILDTQTGKKTLFPSIEQLRESGRQLRISLNLQPIAAVYSKYRYTWFDIFVGILLCVPPTLGFAALVASIHKLRRSRTELQPSPHQLANKTRIGG